jgi:hypothetical protein
MKFKLLLFIKFLNNINNNIIIYLIINEGVQINKLKF